MKGRKAGVIIKKKIEDSPLKKQEKIKVKKELVVVNIAEAKRLYELGLIDEEVAHAFNCSTVTILRLKSRTPELREAYVKGTDAANKRVEQSLFKRACGYDTEEITKEPLIGVDEKSRKVLLNPELKVVRVVKKHVAPDVAAISMWLRNKKAEEWKDLRPVVYQNTQNNLIVHENKVKAEEVDESHIGSARSNFESLRKFRILDAEVLPTDEQS